MQAKNLATWGRIQRDERWSASNEECHLLLSHWNPFIPSSRKPTASPQTRHFSCGQKESHLRSHSRRRKMTMIYFKKRVSSFADSLKSLYVIFHADKNLATWGRIQRDERWWWSASNEECHLLLSHWNPFIPSFRKPTASPQTRHFSCAQKPRHLRSHSRRRKMTMIYFKKRVSSFADSLKSLYVIFHADKNLATWGRIQRDERWCWSASNEECHLLLSHWNPFIPESNRKSSNTSFFMRTKRKPPEVAFKATKDDDDLFQKKSVIFCWLTEVTLCHFSCGQKPSHLRSHSTRRKMMLICFKWRVSSFAVSLKSLHPGKQPQVPKHVIFHADKKKATWGRIQGDERWRWSISKKECHLLLTHWSHFMSFFMRTKT